MANKTLTPNEMAYALILRQFKKSDLARMVVVGKKPLTRQAINKWRAVPGDHVAAIAAGTGFSEAQVRPEPYAKP